MWSYIYSRLLMSVPALIGVSVIVFLMVHLLPGDPARIMAGETASGEAVERIREQRGLNDPLHLQYVDFLRGAVTGDLGRSIRTNESVVSVVLSRVPHTMQLAVAGLMVAIIIGVVIGTIAATNHRSWIDTSSMLFGVIGVSMPNFWLGFLLIFLFSLQLGWLPATGQGGISRLILPAITLGVSASAIISRLTRSSLLEVLNDDYIRVARAKGLRERVVVSRHALRNALIPVVTISGLQFGQLLAGTVVIETVFARQGLGSLTINAILDKDYPVIQGAILFTAAGYVIVNLMVDIAYAVIDPRVRYD